MPIKNHEHGIDICLGLGDVVISTARYEGENADRVIDFHEVEPHPVGAGATPEEMLTLRRKHEGWAPVRIVFGSVEALDVLAERIQRCRDEMAARSTNE